MFFLNFLLRTKGCISRDINHLLTNYWTQKEWSTLDYISSSAFTVPSGWIYNRSFNSKLVFILCFVPQPCYQWIIHLEYTSYSIFSVSIFFLNGVEFTVSLSQNSERPMSVLQVGKSKSRKGADMWVGGGTGYSTVGLKEGIPGSDPIWRITVLGDGKVALVRQGTWLTTWMTLVNTGGPYCQWW